jgi:hypothetical protein
VDGRKLAAFDETLDCPRMNVQELGGLVGCQEAWSRDNGDRDRRRGVVIVVRARLR